MDRSDMLSQTHNTWSCKHSGAKKTNRSKRSSSRRSSGYHISAYTRAKARALHVEVRPSTRKGKKIDVFKNGKKVASVGAMGYNDFTTFSRQNKSKAASRRKAYWSRHRKDEHRSGSPGFYAAHLLW